MIIIIATLFLLILTACLMYFLPTKAEKPNTNYGESTFIIQTGGYY